MILIGALLKCIPAKEANKLNKHIKKGVNEDKKETSKLVSTFKKANVSQNIDHTAMIDSAKNKAGQMGTSIGSKISRNPQSSKGGDTEDVPYDDEDEYPQQK